MLKSAGQKTSPTVGSEKSLGLNPYLLSLNLVWTHLQPSSNRV